jgi:lipopolysaccharide transport protein LptA
VTAATSAKRIKQSQFQSFLLAGLFLFFVGHFLLLSPSSLEDDFGGIRVVEPQNLLSFLKNEPKTALQDIPKDEAPSYSLKDSTVYASASEKPNFKLIASRSNYYQKEQLIHALEVNVTFADGTNIKANESVFFTEKSQANFYGAVHTVFANGATLDSEFATVFMKPVTQVVIPVQETVHGMKVDGHSVTRFISQGLHYKDETPKALQLLSQVQVEIQDEKKEVTHIYSDRAIYLHEAGHLNFVMNEERPLPEQFVKVNQPDLDMKSRTLDVDLVEGKSLQTITAHGDVWIRDAHDPTKISTSTSGKAVFDQKKNDLVLTEFPQVYQEGDTITGDVIIFHRTTDQIEVKQSNAIYNNH